MSTLNLITLPIGNKDDITLRALKALEEFRIFYAEDTRVFKDLLRSYNISFSSKEIDSFHDHSEDKIEKIISRIKSGESVAIVSDAGSPVISDPAYPLIKRAVEEKIEIQNFPGVTSVITALELSGLPTNPFHFWGFFGRTDGDKKKLLNDLKSIQGTHILFESPHRISETVKLFFDVNPESELVLARELTKKFQQISKIRKDDLVKMNELFVEKGEFVFLFNQESKSTSSISNELKNEITDFIDNGGNTKKLAKIFAKILDQDTGTIYDRMNLAKKS